MRLIFDIGGTKMRLAVSEDGQSFGEPKVMPTPANFYDEMAQLKSMATELSGGRKIDVAGGGITGIKNKEKTVLIKSPHLGDWEGKSLKEEMEKVLEAPVYIENDSAIVGLGEAVSGAGKDFPIVVYITVSTGIGGVRIVNGKIDANSLGFEPGHQIIDITNKLTLEEIASGSALQKEFGEEPKEINDTSVWKELAKKLAVGVHNSILHWSPDVVVLGGSMITGDPAISVEDVENELKKIMKIFSNLPAIKKATLEDFGGLHGALAYLKEKIN
jgi:glucokinase